MPQETSLYTITIPVLKKGLTALSLILEKAEPWMLEKGLAEAELMDRRFAPDMFPFVKQVQVACDQAKNFIYRIKGEQPISIPDTECSIAELKIRIASTIDMLDEVQPADVAGHEGQMVELPYFPGKHLTGFDYATSYIMPNFFFHVTTAYDLLRREGMTIGKADFIGGLPLNDNPAV